MIVYILLALGILNLIATLSLAYSARSGHAPDIRSAFRSLIERRSSITSPTARARSRALIRAISE